MGIDYRGYVPSLLRNIGRDVALRRLLVTILRVLSHFKRIGQQRNKQESTGGAKR